MRTRRVGTFVIVFLLVAALGAPAVARQKRTHRASLDGFQEVPAISTTGSGEFRATISKDGTSIDFQLIYDALEGGAATVAHIHLGQSGVVGAPSVFLCGGGVKPACLASGILLEGTIIATDVVGPAGQGIAAGELDELIAAIRDGVTYVNVHTGEFPGGEIRGQIE